MLNIHINLDNISIYSILSLPNQKEGCLSIYFGLLYLNNFLYILLYTFYTQYKFNTKFFIIFDNILNEVIFLISFSVVDYGCTDILQNLCTLILQPEIQMNSFISSNLCVCTCVCVCLCSLVLSSQVMPSISRDNLLLHISFGCLN